MTKESTSSNYPNLVKRITFNDEQTLRKGGGEPTDVVFSEGKGTFNGSSSKVNYDLGLNGTYSVRIRCNPTSFAADRYLFDARGSNTDGVGRILLTNSTGIINHLSGTSYVNGVATTTTVVGVNNEIIISGMTLTEGTGANKTLVGSRSLDITEFLGTIDLVEIYEGTLTPSEVANMANDSWNKEQVFSGAPGVDNLKNWDFTSGWSTNGGTIIDSTSFSSPDGVGRGIYILDTKTVAQKKYRCRVAGTTTTGNMTVRDFNVVGDYKILSGTYDETFEFVAVGDDFFLENNSASTTTITTLELQELEPEILIDYQATNGVIQLGDLGETSTITDVEVVKDGKWSARYNGSTSKIDTGSDVIGTKAITIMGWIKPFSFGENAQGRMMDNGKFIFAAFGANEQLVLSSNGATTGESANNSVVLNKKQFVVACRESDGTVTFRIGDTDGNLAISGAEGQDSGTPEAGSTNVIIGNNDAETRTFDGNTSMITVVDGILSDAQITQFYTESLKNIK